jgi:hypothetical protein
LIGSLGELSGKRLTIAALLLVIVASTVLFLFTGEPYYRGRPVSQWPVDYSQKLYPNGTVPLSASQQGLDALRRMGAEKAATALVLALTRRDSKFYERYRIIYPKLPPWYQNRFPLRLTYQQRVTLILGATQFLDLDYQKAMIPFIVADLQQTDPAGQVASCQLLGSMPESASSALPTLNRLTTSSEISVNQAAQTAFRAIASAKVKPD